MSLYRKQQGSSTLGFLTFVFLAFCFLYVVWKVAPLYLEDHAVSKAMHALPAKLVITNGQSMPTVYNNVKIYLGKNFRVNDVSHASYNDVQINRVSGGYLVILNYEVRQHLVWNIDLLLTFNNQQFVGAG